MPSIDTPSPTPAEAKAARRRAQRTALRTQCSEDRIALTGALLEHLLLWLQQHRPETVLLYSPLDDEPALTSLAPATRALGLHTALPKVEGESLTLHLVDDQSSLIPGAFGIHEPDPDSCPEISVEDVTTVILPALGFDPATGIRLGRGGGYYDRLLARPGFSATTLGVALPWHLLTKLPSEPHDHPVDFLATPSGITQPHAH